MFEKPLIAPSILSADFTDLGEALIRMKSAGADWVHVDVMDGHFVPNLSMGIPVIKCLKAKTDMPLDVHLMIDNPLYQLPWYLDTGVDMVTIHAEVLGAKELEKAIEMAKDAHVKIGVALKPNTHPSVLQDVISSLDMVLVMSVEPGFSGQSYIEGTDEKIERVVYMAKESNCSPLIEIDGGIGPKTAPFVTKAGADVLVCGNAFFKADDPAYVVNQMRGGY